MASASSAGASSGSRRLSGLPDRLSNKPSSSADAAAASRSSAPQAARAEAASSGQAASSTNGTQGDEAPFLSLNPKITPEKALCPPLSASALEEMKKTDPKLAQTWIIWEQLVLPKEKAGQYSDATRQLATINTAKEFWACWNHLPQPSELLDGKKFTREKDGTRTIVDALMVFRKGIQPEWEDPANKPGGHFQIQLKPNLGGGVIDELWNNIVLGMISGAIEPAEMLNGVRLVDKLKPPKPVIRIEVWFNDMDPEDTGRLYKLRGSFERCMRTALNGAERIVTWGYTETKPHTEPAETSARPRVPRR